MFGQILGNIITAVVILIITSIVLLVAVAVVKTHKSIMRDGDNG